MTVRPDTLWEKTVDEGQQRLNRGLLALCASGVVAGLDVGVGILAADHVTGALTKAVGADLAHEAGALFFGIGFVFIAIGGSELFTENFLVPVSTLVAGRASAGQLSRLWGVVMLFNLLGLLIVGYLLFGTGMLKEPAELAAGVGSDTYSTRALGPSLASGLMAGAVVTLWTWLDLATDSSTARIALALITGFVLTISSLNHTIVAFGQLTFGMWAGTAHTTVWQVIENTALALVANVLGGLAFVTITRLIQARGEPGEGDSAGRHGAEG